jgi:hypothetical protein
MAAKVFAVAVLVAACGGARPSPAVDQLAMSDFFKLSATGLVRNQFDDSAQWLTPADHLPLLQCAAQCRSKAARLTALEDELTSNHFAREFGHVDGTAVDFCRAWTRRTPVEAYVTAHGEARSSLPMGRTLVDVLKICVIVKPRDTACLTTFDTYAARLLESETTEPAARPPRIRLQDENTDALDTEITKLVLGAVKDRSE